MFARGILIASFAVTLCSAHSVAAQGRPTAPTLQQLSKKSGFIFAGTVLGITRSGRADSLPILTISLHVDQGIRGVKSGPTFTFRQLAGLQEAGKHYRMGEHVLLFLYPPSKLGLTTPVEGRFGRFEMDGDGRVLLEEARVSALASDPVLRRPLRSVPARRTAAVTNRLFRRAVTRSLESQQ
jgi:hypothetical protein